MLHEERHHDLDLGPLGAGELRVDRVLAPASEAFAASRFPAGHHEGFVEALANIYDEFVAAIVSRKARDFPGAREGIRSMRFVEAALKSAKAGCRWTKV